MGEKVQTQGPNSIATLMYCVTTNSKGHMQDGRIYNYKNANSLPSPPLHFNPNSVFRYIPYRL